MYKLNKMYISYYGHPSIIFCAISLNSINYETMIIMIIDYYDYYETTTGADDLTL